MFLNLSQMRSELLSRLKTHNSLISEERMNLWLNLAQDDVAMEMDPDHLIKPQTITTVANQRKYYLEFDFRKIMSVIDTESNVNMTPIHESQMELIDPDFSDTGTPFFYSVYGYEWVKAQPSAASVITIVSSSTSDNTGEHKVRINGTVDGVEQSELLTLNGTTSVAGLKSFSEIHSIVKNTTTSGIVTVTSNAGAVELVKIAPELLSNPRQPIYLYPIPSDARSVRVRGVIRPRKMINDEDFPHFPEAYHELILHKATERGHKDLMRPTMADLVRTRDYEPMKEILKKQMGDRRGYRSPVVQGRNFVVEGGLLDPSVFGLE